MKFFIHRVSDGLWNEDKMPVPDCSKDLFSYYQKYNDGTSAFLTKSVWVKELASLDEVMQLISSVGHPIVIKEDDGFYGDTIPGPCITIYDDFLE